MNDLDRWAVEYGYSDFDTFLQTGGSFEDAARDIRRRINGFTAALKALNDQLETSLHEALPHASGARRPPKPPETHDLIADAKQAEDEPIDSENAHVQGDDHVVG